jgi:hypothetical protein
MWVLGRAAPLAAIGWLTSFILRQLWFFKHRHIQPAIAAALIQSYLSSTQLQDRS